MASCEDCKLEGRVKALEEDSRRNQETHKEFFGRFERVGENYARIDAQYANIMSTLSRLDSAVEELKAKPARRWESVIAAAITGVVAFVLGLVLRGGV